MKHWQKLKRGYINFLQGSHDHYSWCLPADIGPLASFMLKRIFSGIHLDDDQTKIIKALPPDVVVVYITKQKSYLERLFFYIRFRQLRLPYPEIGFFHKIILWQPLNRLVRIVVSHADYFLRHFRFPDPFKRGYIARALTQGRSALLALVESNDFSRRLLKSKTDPLAYLLGLQNEIARPVFLVPLLLFFETKPRTESTRFATPVVGAEPKPVIWLRLMRLLTKPSKVFAEISEPVNLASFMARESYQRTEDLVPALRNMLLDRITRHRRSITGPVIRSNEEIKQHILTHPRLQEFMETYAERRKMPMYKVHKEALRYVDEIAAVPKPFLVRMAINIVDWLLSSMFEEVAIDKEGLLKVKRAAQKAPLILIPCHKSHIDYLVLSYLMVRNNMPSPHIFAGSNLAFWPMGRLLRWLGAFFVRRSFKGAVFYAKVFGEYIHMLIEQGFNIEVFVEGTRSRTGKLLLPKLGMLSILLNAFKDGAADNLIFAPVFIGYDRVPEEAAYVHEIEGGEKKPENFWQLLRARRILKNRFGKIYVNFSEPLSLADLLADQSTPMAEMSSKQFNILCRDLGQHVFEAINNSTVVTPQSIVSAAILNNAKDIFNGHQLRQDVETYINYLTAQNSHLSETITFNLNHAVDHILNFYAQNKFIIRVSSNGNSPETGLSFKINPAKRAAMDYYKNSCIGCFVPAAFAAVTIIANDSFQFAATDLHEGYAFLKDLFGNEFSQGNGRGDAYQIRKTLKAFINDAVLVPHPTRPETYNITSQGYRKLISFAGFLKPFFDSYWVVLHYFRQTKQQHESKDDRLKDIQKVGLRMHKQHEIVRREALSNINYANAVDFFVKKGIRSNQDTEKIAFFSDAIRNYRQYLM